jgi:hypothetical protein
MSFDETGAQTADAEANRRWAEERVDAFLAATIEGAGVPRDHIEWVREDLVNVYVAGIDDGTYNLLDTVMYDRLQWVAEQLQTERRRDTFAQILMYVTDPWDWMTRWEGFTPDQVGEDPNVLPADAAYVNPADYEQANNAYVRDETADAGDSDAGSGDGWGGSPAFDIGGSSYGTGEQQQEEEQAEQQQEQASGTAYEQLAPDWDQY